MSTRLFANFDRTMFIAERIHDPLLTVDEVRDHRRHWDETPLFSMLFTQAPDSAYKRGGMRDRLRTILFGGVPSADFVDLSNFRIVNLLSPDSKTGSWDARRAKRSAEAIHEALLVDSAVQSIPLPRIPHDLFQLKGPNRIVLLGRRVGAACLGTTANRMGFGTQFVWASHMGLLMPHPSGLNRYWNDPLKVEHIRNRFWSFIK